MRRVRFPPKVVTIYSRKEKEFNYGNNHGCGKLANFQLDNISKFNANNLVIYFIKVEVEKSPIGPKAL